MPTIFEIFGLRFFFYSDEHLPIHVHIEYGGNDAKVEIATRKVVQNQGLARLFRQRVKHRLTMEKIIKISFCGNDICVVTDSGKEYRKALEFFPTLKDATPSQREHYQINKFGDAVRWAEIDEDIHITSLTDGAQPTENAITATFRKFPFLNVSEVARSLGMHKSLLSKYIYGTKKPSAKREKEILDALREFGRQLAQI